VDSPQASQPRTGDASPGPAVVECVASPEILNNPLSQSPLSYFTIPVSRQVAGSNGRVTHNQAVHLRSITVFVHGVNNGPRDLYCEPMIEFLRKEKITAHSIWPTWPSASLKTPFDRTMIFDHRNLGSGDCYDYFIRFNWGEFEDEQGMTGTYNPFWAATFRVGRRDFAPDRATVDRMKTVDIALAFLGGELGWQMSQQQWAGVDRLRKTLTAIHELLIEHNSRENVSINLISHSQGTVVSLAALQDLDSAMIDNWYLLGSTLAQEVLEEAKPDRLALNEAWLRTIPIDKRVILESAYRQREQLYRKVHEKDITSWSSALKHIRNRVVDFWSSADDICTLPLGSNIGHYGLPDGCIADGRVCNVEVAGFLGRGVSHANWWRGDWIGWSEEYRDQFENLFAGKDGALRCAPFRVVFKRLTQIAVDAVFGALRSSVGRSESSVSIVFDSEPPLGKVKQYSLKVIEDLAKRAELASIRITSTFRTLDQQIDVMYENLSQPGGVESQNKLYGMKGEKVIDAYVQERKEVAATEATIKTAMKKKAIEVGFSSQHSRPDYEQYNVIDISYSNWPPEVYRKMREAAEGDARVKRVKGKEENDKALHLEIPVR
jgi:hypothetical protein